MLTEEEIKAFVAITGKLTWPVPKPIFDAMCEHFIVSPIELAVVRDSERGPELLLIHRPKDKYFDGNTWHMPGAIMLPGRTAPIALQELIKREVGMLSGIPEFVGAYDILKGSTFGTCARGQEASRFFMLKVGADDEVLETKEKKFFPLADIKDEFLITNHQLYVRDLRELLKVS